MDRELHIVGAGGHGRVVASLAQSLGFRVVAFYDDRENAWGTEWQGIPIRGPIRSLADMESTSVNFAVGNNSAREKWASEYAHHDFPVLVHPHATLDPYATVLPGTVLCAGARVMVNAAVGAHCIINTNSVVDHDVIVGNFTHVGPGVALAGGVQVGMRVHLDTGASVPYNRVLPDDTKVESGTVFL